MEKIKIVTIIGARPQFIKISSLSRLLKDNKNIEEIIIHTGQHYDNNMSDIFFKELDIPTPKYNLNINNLSHGAMTGRMIEEIEDILIKENPKVVIVFGDTNSTLAGSLAAIKLHIPIFHIEAGLRSYNMNMPEEVNRILTDHISTFLFCPNENSKNNLLKEGINKNIFVVGDIMYDSFLYFKEISKQKNNVEKYMKKPYCLLTIHREENTNDFIKLCNLFSMIENITKEFKYKFLFPIHPRTKLLLQKNNFDFKKNKSIVFLNPVSYIDMLALESNSKLILTDSGGIQKEAYWSKKPCITLRQETEWKELVEIGVNKLVPLNTNLYYEFKNLLNSELNFDLELFGDGKASEKIFYYLGMLFISK